MEADGFAGGDAVDAEFAEFYQGSYARVVTLVAVLPGDEHEAQDVAQDAFARALGRWPRLRKYDVPEAWVREVAFRLAIDAGRRTRRRLLSTRLARAASREVASGAPLDDALEYSQVSAPGPLRAQRPSREWSDQRGAVAPPDLCSKKIGGLHARPFDD